MGKFAPPGLGGGKFNPLAPPGLESISPGGKSDPFFGKKDAAAPSPADAINAAPVPVPQAPGSPSSPDSIDAGRAARRKALKQKGFARGSIFAGDSGGWMPKTNASPTNVSSAAGGATTLGAGA